MTESRRSIDPMLESHIAKEELHDKVQDERLKKIEDDVAEIKKSIQGLLDAWNAANAIGNFLKWVAGLGAGVAVLVEAIKHLGSR